MMMFKNASAARPNNEPPPVAGVGAGGTAVATADAAAASFAAFFSAAFSARFSAAVLVLPFRKKLQHHVCHEENQA